MTLPQRPPKFPPLRQLSVTGFPQAVQRRSIVFVREPGCCSVMALPFEDFETLRCGARELFDLVAQPKQLARTGIAARNIDGAFDLARHRDVYAVSHRPLARTP